MKNDVSFLRRSITIKELIDMSFDVLRDEVCDYVFSEFLTEVCWQVSDKMELLYLNPQIVGSIDTVHRWVRSNFNKYIRNNFDRLLEEEGCNEGFDDTDEDYLSGLMFGVDNN